MGQEAGGMRREIYIETGAESAMDPVEAERAEIARARTEMGGTIDEIQERLTPGYIAGQARTTVADMAGGLRTRVKSSVRENPVPALITTAGLGYLLYKAFAANGSANGSSGDGEYSYEPKADIPARVDALTSAAGSKVGEARATIAETAQAGMAQAQEMAHTAGERTSRTADTVKQAITANPLAAAVVALGIGAAAAMALPNTQVEDQYLGSTGEEVVDRARDTVKQVGQKAKRAAERASDAGRQEMSS